MSISFFSLIFLIKPDMPLDNKKIPILFLWTGILYELIIIGQDYLDKISTYSLAFG